jgi:hypothetical protein
MIRSLAPTLLRYLLGLALAVMPLWSQAIEEPDF